MLVRQIVASVTLAVLLVAWTAGACWPGYVEQAAEQADLVLTAKVTYLGSRSGNNRNKVYDLVRIQAKEFLKGDVLYQDYLRTLTEGLPEEEATMLEDPLDGISDLPQQGSLTLDNTLGVGGVTDHGTCSGRVRVGDVQIFFLRIKTKDEVRKGHRDATFQVTSQPIKINLDVLRLTKAAVQDVPYEPRPPIEEEPCEQQFCAWGGECVTDEEGVATCACPTTCPPPSSTTSPVCGTDGNTYPTICELRRHACRNQREIRIRHSGSCDDAAASSREDDTVRTRAWDRANARDRDPNATRTPDRN